MAKVDVDNLVVLPPPDTFCRATKSNSQYNPLKSVSKLHTFSVANNQHDLHTFVFQLSLRAPAGFDAFKPNILRTNVTFEANIAPHLIPDSLYVGKKQLSKLKGAVKSVIALKAAGAVASTPKITVTESEPTKTETAKPGN